MNASRPSEHPPVRGELFLAFSVLVTNPQKILYTVANPARGLLNRGGGGKSGIPNLNISP